MSQQQYIYIFKGDDTNWNNEQFLTVNITSSTPEVDLSEMTAKFTLGSYTKTYPLTTGAFSVDLSAAVTGAYGYGPICGTIQILDKTGKVKTVSNTIPFYVTNQVIDEQDRTFNAQVSPESPIQIEVEVDGGAPVWGQIIGNMANQADLSAALASKVAKVGDTMTGDLTLAQGASVVMPDGELKDDDGMLQLMGEQYGLKVDTTSGVGAALFTVNGFGEILTTLDLKDTYSATGSDPVTGKAVAQAISTKQDTLSAAQLTAVNSGIDSAKVAQIATNTQAISDEATARENADNGLQGQIDAISAASDVTDVVGTYAELQAYDTSKLKDNDIVKVLDDSTHNDAPSYYRWSTHTHTFTYIGSESASYTKAEADAKFETQTNAAATYATQTALTTGLAGKASNADGTTITDNGTNITTIAVKEQRANTPIKEWVGTKADYDLIEEKDANTLYTITDDDDSQAIVVDSTLSPTSTNPIQNKAVYDALQDLDALPSQTGHAGEYLTTDGTTASWGAVAGGGIQNESTNTGAIAVGGYNSTVSSTYKGTGGTVLLGNGAKARDNNSSYSAVVIGNNAAGANGSTAIGRSANTTYYDKTYNTALGHYADAHNYGVSVGAYAKSYTNAVAIGGGTNSNKTYANGDGAIAIGHQAVAEGANTIQIGTGTNSTAGTVQIGNYPTLDANGKIVSDRLPSGVVTADDFLTVVTNFSSSNYLEDKNFIDFESGTSYDFMYHWKTGTTKSVPIITSIDVEGTGGGFDLAFDSGNGGRLFISQSGASLSSGWSIDTALGNMSTDTEYWLNMLWDGTTYTYILATDKNLTNVVQTTTENYAYPIRNSTITKMRFGRSIRFSNGFSGGTIYISDCYMKINGVKVFDGQRASNYNIIGAPYITTLLY